MTAAGMLRCRRAGNEAHSLKLVLTDPTDSG
jgi:hypothetical protein